jgi:predicted aspartyl protease
MLKTIIMSKSTHKWIPTSDSALAATIVILSLCNMILALWLDNMAWMLLSAFLWASLFVRIVFSGNDDSDSPEVGKQEIKLSNDTAYDCLISGGYEFVQAAQLEDGRFEVVMTKNGRTVTLLTDEPFVPKLSV